MDCGVFRILVALYLLTCVNLCVGRSHHLHLTRDSERTPVHHGGDLAKGTGRWSQKGEPTRHRLSEYIPNRRSYVHVHKPIPHAHTHTLVHKNHRLKEERHMLTESVPKTQNYVHEHTPISHAKPPDMGTFKKQKKHRKQVEKKATLLGKIMKGSTKPTHLAAKHIKTMAENARRRLHQRPAPVVRISKPNQRREYPTNAERSRTEIESDLENDFFKTSFRRLLRQYLLSYYRKSLLDNVQHNKARVSQDRGFWPRRQIQYPRWHSRHSTDFQHSRQKRSDLHPPHLAAYKEERFRSILEFIKNPTGGLAFKQDGTTNPSDIPSNSWLSPGHLDPSTWINLASPANTISKAAQTEEVLTQNETSVKHISESNSISPTSVSVVSEQREPLAALNSVRQVSNRGSSTLEQHGKTNVPSNSNSLVKAGSTVSFESGSSVRGSSDATNTEISSTSSKLHTSSSSRGNMGSRISGSRNSQSDTKQVQPNNPGNNGNVAQTQKMSQNQDPQPDKDQTTSVQQNSSPRSGNPAPISNNGGVKKPNGNPPPPEPSVEDVLKAIMSEMPAIQTKQPPAVEQRKPQSPPSLPSSQPTRQSRRPSNEPVSQSRPRPNEPVSQSRPRVNEPVSQSRPRVNQPVSQSRPRVNEPVSQSRPRVNQPVSQSRPRVNEHVSQSRPRVNEHVSQSRPRPNEPVSQSRPRPNEPVSQSRPRGNQPVSQSRPRVNEPVRQTRPANEPVSQTRPREPLSQPRVRLGEPLSQPRQPANEPPIPRGPATRFPTIVEENGLVRKIEMPKELRTTRTEQISPRTQQTVARTQQPREKPKPVTFQRRAPQQISLNELVSLNRNNALPVINISAAELQTLQQSQTFPINSFVSNSG